MKRLILVGLIAMATGVQACHINGEETGEAKVGSGSSIKARPVDTAGATNNTGVKSNATSPTGSTDTTENTKSAAKPTPQSLNKKQKQQP